MEQSKGYVCCSRSDATTAFSRRAPAASSLAVQTNAASPFLSIAVLFAGVEGSAVAAWWWPLDSSGNEISRFSEVLDPGAPRAVFDLPLFMLGAGPSLVASESLGGAASMVVGRPDTETTHQINGLTKADSVVFGDVANNLCETAVVLNPDLATSVSSLPFFELPEVDRPIHTLLGSLRVPKLRFWACRTILHSRHRSQTPVLSPDTAHAAATDLRNAALEIGSAASRRPNPIATAHSRIGALKRTAGER
ncbi:MAG: hypothetical protein ACJAR2_001168 [Ilumatobacter sp.]